MVDSGKIPLPRGFTRSMLRDNFDPNKYPHSVAKHIKLVDDFHMNIKHRAVSNAISSSLSEEW